MKLKIAVLALTLGATLPAVATNYTWRFAGSDWGTATNWTTNAVISATVPGASDTALFQNSSATFPAINDARAIYQVNGSAQQQNMTIGGTGTLTIGAGGIVGQTYNNLIFSNTLTLNLSASQPWRPTSARTIIVQSPVTGTGNISNYASDVNCTLKYGGAPAYVTGATFTGNLAVNGPAVQRGTYGGGLIDNGCQFWLDFGTVTTNTTATFGLTPGATPSTNILNGAAFFIKATASSGNPLAECNNPFVIAAGGGGLYALQNSGAIAKWSGAITLGGPLFLADDQAGSTTFTNLYTGAISLNQNAAGRLSIANIPGLYNPNNTTILGSISDAGNSFRNPLLLHSSHDTLILNAAAAGMTYTNGTVADSCGSYSAQSSYNGIKARIDVASGSRAGTGNLMVLPGGVVRLLGAGTLAGTATLQSGSSAVSVLGITNSAISSLSVITSDSSGVLALETGSNTFTMISDLSTVGNGRMFLGSVGGGNFTGTALAPGLDNKYRLGGGGLGSGALSISNSVLSGTASLQVGLPKWEGGGQVILNASNTFTGDIDVYSMPVPSFNGPGNTAASPMVGGISSLVGKNVAGGNALGDTNGAVHLHCGDLAILAGNGTGQKKGALDFEGGSSLTAILSTGSNYLTLASLTRSNRGILFFDFANKAQQAACRILSTNTPPVNNGMVDPWGCYISVAYALGPDFATYDASLGVGQFAAYGVLSSPGSVDAVVTNTAGNLPGGTCSAYALKVSSAITGTGTIYLGNTNKSSVAGLLLGANVAPDVNFGGAEGVIIAAQSSTLSGKISGSNGITIAGNSLAVTLSNTNNDFTGQLTVNNNQVNVILDTTNAAGILTSSLGPVSNTIFLNGGVLATLSNNVLNAGRTITLGVCGGSLGGSTAAAASMTAAARITGAGTLMLCPVNDNSQTFTISGANNDYLGGTRLMVYGKTFNSCATLIASSGATLGTGDLNIDAYCAATLLGTNNIAPGAIAQVNTRATLNLQGTNNVILGGLTGSGDVVLGNNATNDTILNVGGGDISSTFYGRISEASAMPGQGQGSLVKTGNGTFTLYGSHTFTGTNTVKQGTLVLMGSVASNVVINAGGTLGGMGVIGGNLTLAGTLAATPANPPLTVNGNIALSGTLTVPTGTKVSAAGVTVLSTVSGTISGSFSGTPPGIVVRKTGTAILLLQSQGTTCMFH